MIANTMVIINNEIDDRNDLKWMEKQ
jgi:hypothetical protein